MKRLAPALPLCIIALVATTVDARTAGELIVTIEPAPNRDHTMVTYDFTDRGRSFAKLFWVRLPKEAVLRDDDGEGRSTFQNGNVNFRRDTDGWTATCSAGCDHVSFSFSYPVGGWADRKFVPVPLETSTSVKRITIRIYEPVGGAAWFDAVGRGKEWVDASGNRFRELQLNPRDYDYSGAVVAYASPYGDQMPTEYENASGLTGGFRISMFGTENENAYINDQITRFQDEELPIGVAMSMALIGGVNWLLAEVEGGFSVQTGELYDGTHKMEAYQYWVNLWLRPRLRVPLTGIYLGPGIAAGYAWGTLDVWDRDREDENGNISNPTRLLDAEGPVYSAGMVVEFGKMPKWGISLEYRYMWAQYVAEKRPGTEFIFPDEAEFDFTGHLVGIGVTFNGP
jgi:hypothetical protein